MSMKSTLRNMVEEKRHSRIRNDRGKVGKIKAWLRIIVELSKPDTIKEGKGRERQEALR